MYEHGSNHSDRRFRPEQTPEDELADWITLAAKQDSDWWRGILAPLYEEIAATMSLDEERVALGNAYTGALLAAHTSDADMFRHALTDIACVARGFSPEVIHAKVDRLVAGEQSSVPFDDERGEIRSKSVKGYDGLAQPYDDQILSWDELLDYTPPAPNDGSFSDFWPQ